jgi:hypothetical protein
MLRYRERTSILNSPSKNEALKIVNGNIYRTGGRFYE